MADESILHCDCNSFFASVETALHPEYRNVPMAVCGNEEDRHGIVLAKNDLAKQYGIQTAQTVHSARRLCPGLVIAPPHYSEYVRFSKAVNAIYADYTDLIEPFGIDESWLDVSASRRAFGSGFEIAEKIRNRVKSEVGITVSIGVSFNKTFAKLGSDYKKPDAVTCITRENYRQIVYPLPVGALLFVGKKTEESLRACGIRTVGELSLASAGWLTQKFGKAGVMLYNISHGVDDSPVTPPTEDRKSVGNGFTFRHDLVGAESCRAGIWFLSEEIGEKLRRMGMKANTVVLRVKDENLTVYQKQKQVRFTDLSREIAAAAYELYLSFRFANRPVRMLNVTATGLVKKEFACEQMDLFSGETDKRRERSEKRESAVDAIRAKFGRESIVPGSVIDTDIGVYDRKNRKKEDRENKEKQAEDV